jgi:phosphate starvation-inducible PhoH-like protein
MPPTKSRLTPKDFHQINFTPKQKKYCDCITENTITFCWGPAGSSKTFSACYAALKMVQKGEIEKIIFTKPNQESGEKLGSLPGDVSEKISPFMESFLITMEKIITKEKLGQLISEKIIEFRPLAYMRGATFDRAMMILDEAQNCDMKQLMLYISRVGDGSKVLVAGDITQHDISYEKVALPIFVDLLQGIEGVGEFRFGEEDIVRSKILKEIVRRYEQWKYKLVGGTGNQRPK